MGFRSGLAKRGEVVAEFYRMVRDRRAYLLAPLLISIVTILIFMFVAEMPVLIPFFYAVF